MNMGSKRGSMRRGEWEGREGSTEQRLPRTVWAELGCASASEEAPLIGMTDYAYERSFASCFKIMIVIFESGFTSTSRSRAVWGDCSEEERKRDPQVPTLVYPLKVQGLEN